MHAAIIIPIGRGVSNTYNPVDTRALLPLGCKSPQVVHISCPRMDNKTLLPLNLKSLLDEDIISWPRVDTRTLLPLARSLKSPLAPVDTRALLPLRCKSPQARRGLHLLPSDGQQDSSASKPQVSVGRGHVKPQVSVGRGHGSHLVASSGHQDFSASKPQVSSGSGGRGHGSHLVASGGRQDYLASKLEVPSGSGG